MAGKDLLEVIAEMSGKQDHNSELIGVTNILLIKPMTSLKKLWV